MQNKIFLYKMHYIYYNTDINTSGVWFLNISHLKYAVTIAKYGSINRAAEVLLMNQPNLSRAVKELENDLGVKIFARSAKGMVATAEGEQFLQQARLLLKKADEIDNMFKAPQPEIQKFSLAAPDCSYISDAYTRLCSDFPHARLSRSAPGTTETIRAVADSECRLGIIRFAAIHDKYYKRLLDEKELDCELAAEFELRLLVRSTSPLAGCDTLPPDAVEVRIGSQPDEGCICVSDRLEAYRLLAQNDNMYMPADPVSEDILSAYSLARAENFVGEPFKDLIIHKKNYRLSELDKSFITALCTARRQIFQIYHS